MRKKWVMRALWMALMLVSVPGGVLAQSVQDWRLCRAVDADHLVIPACTRLIEQNKLSQGDRGIKGDLDTAIADATRAIEIDPQYAWGFMSRGVLHSKRREPGPAHADFGKAIEIEPHGGFDGYRVRGMAFALRGDYRHAFADYSRWIEIDPNCAFAYALRGETYLRNGDEEHALADESKALEIDPRSADGHRIRGVIYQARGDQGRAVDQ